MKSLISFWTKNLRHNCITPLSETEELVRRCKSKVIRNNGKIHKNAFYFGHPEVSVDRRDYRHYKKTIDSYKDWILIEAIVEKIRPIQGVKEVKPNPISSNLSHTLIVCDLNKRNIVAENLSGIFKQVTDEKFNHDYQYKTFKRLYIALLEYLIKKLTIKSIF